MGNHPASRYRCSLRAARLIQECAYLIDATLALFRSDDSEATGSQTEPTPRTCQTLSIVLISLLLLPNVRTLQPLPLGTGNREHCRSMEQEGNEVTRMCGGGWKSGITMARSREKPRDTQRGNSSRSSTGLLATS
jgi:hypothetical protein